MNCLRTTILSMAATLLLATACWAQDVDFNRDVRPILSDKCYFCHGPDESNQQAGLRLDSHDEAADVIDSGDLIDRITSDDPDMVMPPPQTKLSLTKTDIETMRAWIEQGADYDQHWAFELLPKSVSIPTVDNKTWPKQPLDQFVLAKLETADLEPSSPANPLRWLRRATLDLTGLPPSPEEIESFEQALGKMGDDGAATEHAYAAVADRLLASPAFGEQMAVAWLDAARYADSYGYQSDKLNTQWPYRDWVVQAFNNNLPYDDFLTWQLAGDLLDNPTREQKLATAFNRIHRLNNEGGAVFEEWRIENVADRVHTFGTALLGLTLECCRCHDHKYDPIPAKDYYSLSAFFNSIDESGVYDRSEKVPCPSLLLPTPAQQIAIDQAHNNVKQASAKLTDLLENSHDRWEAWKASAPQNLPMPEPRLALAFDYDFTNEFKQIYHPSESDRAWSKMPELVEVEDCQITRMDLATAADVPKDATETPPPRRAMKLDGERGITTKGIEPFDRWAPFTVVISMKETKRVTERALIAHHTRGTDCGYNGWDLTVQDGHLESRLYRVWPGNSIGVRTTEPIPADVWHQVVAAYDGSSTAKGLQLFLNGQPLETTILRDNIKKSANVLVDHGGEFVVGQRFRARGLDGGLIDDVRVFERLLSQTEIVSLATGQPIEPTLEYYLATFDKQAGEALAQCTAARKAFVMAEEAVNEIPVMKELSAPRPAHLLARGEYDAPKTDATMVRRETPSVVPLPFPVDAPRDRLGLARWVTNPQHPLTARVAVNRLWGNFFSSPLVRTPENFGSQGEPPTHPQLLDWLARDFVDNGWNIKRLCKQVVLSATYRQDSSATPVQLERDPTNELLARGPAYRLAAEQIRDLALAASSLLETKRGGPPVSPYQPGEDLWKESNGMSPPYQQSVGKSLYRRSLYSVWKRTAPLPNMMAFDSTTREVCTVKRSRTNTPLQALVLLNDVQFVEAAVALAEPLLSLDNDAARIDKAFQRLAGRKPDDSELQILQTLLQDERAYYANHADEATALVSTGERKVNKETNAAELAAMTTVCQAILNLDATIWKR